jgi:hypothetical protein
MWTAEHRVKYARPERRKNRHSNPRFREMQQVYYQRHRAKTIAQNWVRQIGKLGCTPGMYEDLFEKQGGLCAICGKPNIGGRRLAVDHDHATNRVRGLLCNLCNAGLGAFKDNETMIRRALEYLCPGTK